MAWLHLGHLGELYHEIYRMFRKKYKWPPYVVDREPVWRIMKIFHELVDEVSQEEDIDEDDYE